MSSSNKKSVAVRIAGHEYKILTESDGDSLKQIARDVDRAMARVRARTGTVDTLDIAVLTCLNLAREITVLRNQSNEIASDDRIRELINRVEALLPEHAAGEGASQAATASTATQSREQESPRTLDLPSFEALRERSTAAADAASSSMPEPRVAAGGRERAS